MRPHLWMLPALLLAARGAPAQQRRLGIAGQPAPSWGVTQWLNLPKGKKSLDVGDYRGRVLYLYCFQSWCPGCHRYGFPTLQRVTGHYKDERDVAFVAVQTTFEGFGTNTPARAKQTAARYKLSIPVGHSGARDKRSELMRRYRTGGTPWTVIIDRSGRVRFNDFHIAPQQATALIDKLLKEKARTDEPKATLETLPASRGGQDVVGTSMPKLHFDRWVNTPEKRPLDTSGSVTLYRWWTDTCPFCRASLPAIEKLRRKYGDKLKTAAVYHPKPPRPIADDAIHAAAQRFGYSGPIAVDLDWSELKSFYLSSGRRRATSVAFLVDAKGVIRFVHPGPVFFPSDDPRQKQQNDDYQLLDRAIAALLAED